MIKSITSFVAFLLVIAMLYCSSVKAVPISLQVPIRTLESYPDHGGAVFIAPECDTRFHWFQNEPVTAIQINKRLNQLYYGKDISLNTWISYSDKLQANTAEQGAAANP
jgi:hypothetical protein